MLQKKVALIGAAALTLALAACGGAPQPAGESAAQPAAKEVVLTVGNELKFHVPTVELKAGEPVRLVLKNEGALEHDFTVDTINVDGEMHDHTTATGGQADLHLHAGPGETDEVVFTPEESGTYTFYCSVPGHKEAGMTGTLSVE